MVHINGDWCEFQIYIHWSKKDFNFVATINKFLIRSNPSKIGHKCLILSARFLIVGLTNPIEFQAIGGVLIPEVLQPLPASLTQAIRQFAKQLCVWLDVALTSLPEGLRNKKLSSNFCTYLSSICAALFLNYVIYISSMVIALSS